MDFSSLIESTNAYFDQQKANDVYCYQTCLANWMQAIIFSRVQVKQEFHYGVSWS